MILQKELEECNEYYDLFERYSDYIQSMKCDGVYVVGVSDLAAARNNAHFRKHGYDIDDEVVLYADDKDNGKLEFKSVNDLMQYILSSLIYSLPCSRGLRIFLSKRYLRIQIMSLRISTTMMRSQACTIVWHAMRWSFLCLLSLKLRMSAAP